MIQILNKKYNQVIAYFLLLVFISSSASPAYASGNGSSYKNSGHIIILPSENNYRNNRIKNIIRPITAKPAEQNIPNVFAGSFSGGPSQPEMSTFKSVSTDNMVNLFTGDFSYNIPLLDVGGYPVNIYYDANIGLEQEASWVGLGWNINPGSISRNMRGIPDDFDGTDIMTETQNVKPNTTWGGRLGADWEFGGIKTKFSGNLDVNLGASFNNYLGPAIDIAVKGGINVGLANKIQGEKGTLTDTVFGISLGGSGSASLSSRDGLTVSGSASLTKRLFAQNHLLGLGFSVGSSYNSRIGIKDMQISGQMSENNYKAIDAESVKPIRNGAGAENMFSTTISFARPSYVPVIRMPMTNTSCSGHLELGSGLFGQRPGLELEIYGQESHISAKQFYKPLVGYMYYQNAVNNDDAVMDFTRLGDKEVTATTPIISAPQYTYDIFSIQGEGTGGTVRAYRTDLGYVKDNKTVSTDNSWGGGLDFGPMGHYGGNFNIIKTPTSIGKWDHGNNLDKGYNFQQNKDLHELVYLRNPGESSVLDDHAYDKIGNTDLVRFQLGGDASNPTIEPLLQHFTADPNVMVDNQPNPNPVVTNIATATAPSTRAKRSQVITFLTADEATRVGLDKTIKSYDPINILASQADVNDLSKNIYYLKSPVQIPRASGYRKGHHISQINVTEADGKRYVYGIPVYNMSQTDFTFSVNTLTNPDEDRVQLLDNNGNDKSQDWMSPDSKLINQKGVDGYFQSTTTPPYAHSFLLSGLLSPDYVDVTGDGITEDDLGDAVKFNYSLYLNTDGTGHKWRTPLSDNHDANFNAGNRTETKDDKGIVSYGEREQWYLHSLESKTMIAVFTLAGRDDGKGAKNEFGGRNGGDNTIKRLDKIDLYNKADLKLHGLTGIGKAMPIKTVHFVYSYRLCYGTPENMGGTDRAQHQGGKLTLESIYFTFNGQERLSGGQAARTQYKFSYASSDENESKDNPDYVSSATDRWGTYKPNGINNPANLPNKDYPYSLQGKPGNASFKDNINTFAGAWALKKILLPSGGQIEVTYESDDYSYVQTKPAAQMMQVVGFGQASGSYPDNVSHNLYDYTSVSRGNPKDNFYVFISVPKGCSTKADVLKQYFTGYNTLSQLAFRYAVIMPKGEEYVTSYAHIAPVKVDGNETDELDLGPTSNPNVIWINLKDVDTYSPLTLTALEYLREQLPGQAYPGYDMSDFQGGAFEEIATMIGDMLGGLGGAFKHPVDFFRSQSQAFARTVSSNGSTLKCFVRLNIPLGINSIDGTGVKYGGGSRVKQILLKDNWNKMTPNAQAATTYGQAYEYTTTEKLDDNTVNVISSGVASYEPSIGAEENPFTNVAQYENRLPLGPVSYGSIELPTLDAFFPAPVVGYSKVTVRSLADRKAIDENKPIKSAIGRQVTEFYTAKDFPVLYNYTPLAEVSEHDASLLKVFHKEAFDYRSLSQGFIVATNDMHGKLKKQSSYSAKDDNTMVNYTENYYTNTGANYVNDQFDFVDGNNGGKIAQGNMGVDVELMTDTREFAVSSHSAEVQAQLDFFPIVLPFWLPFIWPVTGESESIYRAVTTTKVVNYHSVVDKVLVMDKGSKVITQNLLRDAQTGEVVVNQTDNEFNQPIYTTTYPAYWAYSGMGPAYQNIDNIYNGVNFSNGIIGTSNGVSGGPQVPISVFESGDELLVLHSDPPTGCDLSPEVVSSDKSSIGPDGFIATPGTDIIWAFNTSKNISSLTDHSASPSFVFIDATGKPYTRANVSFRIIRSGKRNMLGASLQGITNMLVNPIAGSGVNRSLTISNSNNVINASAIEYKEKWQTDKDEVKTFTLVSDPCPRLEEDCNGTVLENSINPYCKGLLGNFRPYKNFVYYGNRVEHDLTPSNMKTNLPKNGFLDGFNLYWNYDAVTSLTPNTSSNSKWVFQSRTTRKNARGMELENVDALNIYTSAQYGYSKTLPVAITNNAAYSEAAYEGFEDNAYSNRLNKYDNSDNSAPLFCTNKKYIDFTDMLQNGTVGNVINTDDLIGSASFNAHTGKYVMSINAGQTATKNIGIDLHQTNDFALAMGSQRQEILKDLGGNEGALTGVDSHVSTFSAGHPFVSINVKPTTVDNGNNTKSQSYSVPFNFYIEVTQAKTYVFTFKLSTHYSGFNPQLQNMNGLSVQISNKHGGLPYIDQFTLTEKHDDQTELGNTQNRSVFLCAGKYFISGSASMSYTTTVNGNPDVATGNTYTWECLDAAASQDYQNLSTTDGCAYTVPILGDNTMLHPSFTIPASSTNNIRKMVFSAWVREDAAGSSTSTYNNNHVAIDFGSGFTANNVTLTPKGAVIDGWQRYEGYFTVPVGATSMALNFANTFSAGSGKNIYFDDIRIHPFNANMKSYVYDPVTQRLVAQLDANNYASFYEYDEEGTLIRTKAETIQGIKTINETRSAKQKTVQDLQ